MVRAAAAQGRNGRATTSWSAMGPRIGPMSDATGYGLTPLAGGWSGETFLADAGGQRTVVRVYGVRGASRGPEAPAVDAAVLGLVRGLLPVPEVLEVRRPDRATQAPGMLVTTLLPGERLDLVLPGLDAPGRRTVGAAVGEVAARLAQMPLPTAGLFVDARLAVEPFPAGDLVGFVEHARTTTSLAAWPLAAFDDLLVVAEDAQALLDETRRTCLVHGDLNPKNLLVDPATLAVTGVLDWEFAHAGAPGADLGNLLRFERDEAYTAGVLDEYRARVPDADAVVLDRARAADLLALVDLAGRRGQNPVADQADRLLRAIAASGDLHALP